MLQLNEKVVARLLSEIHIPGLAGTTDNRTVPGPKSSTFMVKLALSKAGV